MIISKITAKLLYVVFFLDVTKNLLLPRLSLLLWICILMAADVITGLIRSSVLKQPITSSRARGTIVKFLQYFGCIGLTVVLINQNHDNKTLVQVMEWAKDGLVILIIYIECLSIFENLYAMDKTTPMAVYVIQPIYWLLSLAVRKNPLTRAQQQAKREVEKKEDDRLAEKSENFNKKHTTHD